MYKNKKRYGNLVLPKSLNSSVYKLKLISRRLKYEIDNHPVPVKRDVLSKTWIEVNKVLQRMRQLESDHIKIEKSETNEGRKKYQKSLINDVKNDQIFVQLSKEKMKSHRGITVSVNDVYKPLDLSIDSQFVVVAIGQPTYNPFKRNIEDDYIITLKERFTKAGDKVKYYSTPIYALSKTFYLYDHIFFDTDYTPNYCEHCDTYHDSWANDGGLKLND